MSAQPHATPSGGPTSSSLLERARHTIDRLRKDPNPILIRELKQSARLTRTPLILAVLTVLITLLIASIGGASIRSVAPATIGVSLFHVFFSLAFFVVALVGPAVAANGIASEREGRTWEAVVLTGMRPAEIARGKFLAAITAIGMYVVMLSPVGAMPLLCGGVTATEILIAFVFLLLIALLGVAFGLAVSSKMSSLRTAIVATMLLAFPISLISFSCLGAGLSFAANAAWPAVPAGHPIWLPTAYLRAPFGLPYVVFLFVLPVTLIALPAWFLYETTVANLSSASDDRSTGIKRWFWVTAPALTLSAGLPILIVDPADRETIFVVGMCVLATFFCSCVFLFQGEPIVVPRRVQARFDEIGAGAFRRFMGPGLMRTAALLAGTATAMYVALTTLALLSIGPVASTPSGAQAQAVGAFVTYALSFTLFAIGLGTWLRSRAQSSLAPRLMYFAALFAIFVGPWIVVAIAWGSGENALVLAAPSPFYAFVMLKAALRGSGSGATSLPSAFFAWDTPVFAGMVCATGWAFLGLSLLAAARARCAAVIAEDKKRCAEVELMFAAEATAAEALRDR